MQYEVRMLAPEGVVSQRLEAIDRSAAAQQAAARGLPVLSIVPCRTWRLGAERFSLVLFTQELLALLRAGLGLIEAIRALAERQSAAGRSILRGALDRLHEGKPLSAALAQFPQAFPLLYVETVRASERTGAIVDALSRFVHYQGQVDQIRQKVVSALIYPVLLCVVGLGVAAFLVGYVVPRFSAIYLDMDKELPWASRVLFELGAAVDRYALWLGVLAVAAVLGVLAALRSGALQAAWARLLPAVPFFGPRMRVYRLTRFYRTIAMLLQGGVPLVSALRMVAGLVDEASRRKLDAAIRDVHDGGRLSEALARHGLTTPIAQRMLEVGERSGDLGGLLEQAAAFHEDELGRWVERATRVLEPLLMLFIGVLIGAIVVLMYMPIFDLAGTLQ